MKVGTKSLLFGCHQFILHPLIVAYGWWKLYGFPFDPRLWVAFLVHDWGYFGQENMDGTEGSKHPELGAVIMTKLFDLPGHGQKGIVVDGVWYGPWGTFALLHSRTYSKKAGHPESPLCAADKMFTVVTPKWLWVSLATLSGEMTEYMASDPAKTKWEWIENARARSIQWIMENR